MIDEAISKADCVCYNIRSLLSC